MEKVEFVSDAMCDVRCAMCDDDVDDDGVRYRVRGSFISINNLVHLEFNELRGQI